MNLKYKGGIQMLIHQTKNILYLGWLGKGNVGDDVLFELFKTMFYKYHLPKKFSVNIDAFPIVPNYKIDLTTYDLIILGGGSLIHLSYWLEQCVKAISYGIPVVSWGTGFDGYYKQEHFETLSLQNSKYFKNIYEHFDYLSVRGPFTKKALTNIGVEKEIHEIGDPAFAFADETFRSNLKTGKQNNTILINWGTSYNNIFGGNELTLELELVATIRTLISKGYDIIIYPIWTEDVEAVKQLAQKVNDNKCIVQTEVFAAKILQKLINASYLSINLKLHANILSAAANRPFISLAYRGKCFDFAKTVHCLDYTVATDVITSSKIVNLVQNIENNYDDVVNRFKRAKEKYYPRLFDSIQSIATLLE